MESNYKPLKNSSFYCMSKFGLNYIHAVSHQGCHYILLCSNNPLTDLMYRRAITAMPFETKNGITDFSTFEHINNSLQNFEEFKENIEFIKSRKNKSAKSQLGKFKRKVKRNQTKFNKTGSYHKNFKNSDDTLFALNNEDFPLKGMDLNLEYDKLFFEELKSNSNTVSKFYANSALTESESVNSFLKNKEVIDKLICPKGMWDILGRNAGPICKIDKELKDKNFNCYVNVKKLPFLNRLCSESKSNEKFYFCEFCTPKRIFLSDTSLAQHFIISHGNLFQNKRQFSFQGARNKIDVIEASDDDENKNFKMSDQEKILIKKLEQIFETKDKSKIFSICQRFMQKLKRLPMRNCKGRPLKKKRCSI